MPPEPGDGTSDRSEDEKRRTGATAGDNARMRRPTCSEDPDSRQCEDERRPPAQEDPRGTQLHRDEPPTETSGCGKPEGCKGSSEPDH